MSITGKIVANITGKIVIDITDTPQGGSPYGPELVTDPNFQDSALTGWESNNGNSTLTHRSSDNTALFENQADWSYMVIWDALDIGKTYQVRVEVESVSGSFHIGPDNISTEVINADGVYEYTHTVADNGSIQVRPRAAGLMSVRLISLSIREIL